MHGLAMRFVQFIADGFVVLASDGVLRRRN
jgi:hypothetical protein